MIAAALGHLPPVAGALLQEAIDVAVILNALRVLTGEAAPAPLTDRVAVGRVVEEHARLRALLDRMRRAADRMDQPPETAIAELRGINAALNALLLPHQLAEEQAVFPELAQRLGGRDPLGCDDTACTRRSRTSPPASPRWCRVVGRRRLGGRGARGTTAALCAGRDDRAAPGGRGGTAVAGRGSAGACLTLDAAHPIRSIAHMRIVIMGAGGLGGYFGARLAAAGNDVAFVARGAHLAAIRAQRAARGERARRSASARRGGDRRSRDAGAGGRGDDRGEAVGHRGRRRGGEAAGAARHRRGVVPERRRQGRGADAHPWARRGDRRRRPDRRGDRQPRRDPPHRHHGEADLRGTRQHAYRARRRRCWKPAPRPGSTPRSPRTSTWRSGRSSPSWCRCRPAPPACARPSARFAPIRRRARSCSTSRARWSQSAALSA